MLVPGYLSHHSKQNGHLSTEPSSTARYIVQRRMAHEAQTHASNDGKYNNRWLLTGHVQVDDAYWGGERHGGRRGRGSENKAPFVAAVQTNSEAHPVYMRFNAVENFRRKTMKEWAEHALNLGTQVVSDGLSCFRGVADAGCRHTAVVTGGGHESMENELFTWVNTMLGNMKTALAGTYHKLNPKHLGRYLGEFNYRFNKRFDMPSMIKQLAQAAVHTAPMPGRLLKLADVQW